MLRRWCNADDEALRLASLPCKMGGLGITSTILKQRYLFSISRNSIDEQLKPTNAPVDITGERKGANHKKISSQAARTDFKKQIKLEHETLASELMQKDRFAGIMKRSKEANLHLAATNNYVNPYLFRYTLMMRLGIALQGAPNEITCPGCGATETPHGIIPHM